MKFELFAIYVLAYCNKCFADIHLDDAIRHQVTYLEPGAIVDYEPSARRRGFFHKDMRIYCYRGSTKDITKYFEAIELQLEIANDEFTQYEGATPTEVQQHFEERQSLFSFNLFTHKRTRLHLSPFKKQCIGIDTELSYRVRLRQFRVDYFQLIQLALGICVFFLAEKLSHNSMFYYLTGVALGICCSFMLIIWLCSKLMPRRPMMYGMMIGGWTLGVYIIQRLWENVHLIFQMYRNYVIWYIFITGLLAFFFCYRIGPPKNQRSKNIVKWVLQIMAITLIYFSSQYEEASAAIGAVIFIINYFPYHVFRKVRRIYRRFFPKQRRLLTSEEYHEQGIIETAKALNELRSYASSPDCKQWKIISKLSDPLRFASFVEGESHLREEEIAIFESFRQANEMDDSDLSEDGDEKIVDDSQRMSFYTSQHVNEQEDSNAGRKAVRKVTYEEMSEEEYGNEDDTDTKGIIVTAATKPSFYNLNAGSEQSRESIGLRHSYSPKERYIHVTKVNALPARGEHRHQQQYEKTTFTSKPRLRESINSNSNRVSHEFLDK